jgi:hypothetical protein
MSKSGVVVQAAEAAYLTASGFQLNMSNFATKPSFSAATFNPAPGNAKPYSGYLAVIQPYTLTGTTYVPVTSTSGALVKQSNPVLWPTGASGQQGFSVPAGNGPVYFAALDATATTSTDPGTSKQYTNDYWNVYLSMDSAGPYTITFNASVVGGPDSLTLAGFSYLQSPMTQNDWSLTQQPGGDAGNDFVLTYSGTSTNYIPYLTIRTDDANSSFSFFKVTSTSGFGIQMISTFDFLVFTPYIQSPILSPTCSPGSGSSGSGSQNNSMIETTTVGAAIVIGAPLLIIFILCLSFGLALRKSNKKCAGLVPKPK